MRPVATSFAILVLAALGATGCGQAQTKSADSFKGVEKHVATMFDDLASAAKRADARKICDTYLSAALKARLTRLARTSKRGTDCADQLKDSIRDADAFDLDVKSVKVSGSTATATVLSKTTAERDPIDTVKLVDERGWRIAELAPAQ